MIKVIFSLFFILMILTCSIGSAEIIRLNGTPSENIAWGTLSINISLTTDQNANCRYSENTGINYDNMTHNFTTTGTTLHSELIFNITNNQSYIYCIKCANGTDIDTDDYTISFETNRINNAVTQHGMTWTFDDFYSVGTFANGDYWVKGPLNITSITPDFDGTSYGWEVNPIVAGLQGFQSGCTGGSFNSSLVPTLPYTTPQDEIISVVKTLPTGIAAPCIQTAAVLTIVTDLPPNNGSTVFRPPYIASNKPYYNVSDLRWDLLPSYLPVNTDYSLGYIESRFKNLRLDHKPGEIGRFIRPADAMENYQPKNSEDIYNSVLRFMLNDSSVEKTPAMIQYIQMGIDQIYITEDGQTWPAGGGHEPSHILPQAFTMVMLDMNDSKLIIKNATYYHGSKYLSTSMPYGSHLWGEILPETVSEYYYWYYIRGLGSGRSNSDPYNFIDGGICGWDYQVITTQSHKGDMLAVNLMPILINAWPTDDLKYSMSYIPRWVNFGIWAQSDPCAPYDGNVSNYTITYGADPLNPGMCILDSNLLYYTNAMDFECTTGEECGRYPNKHGTQSDTGSYRSTFAADMWDTYSLFPPSAFEFTKGNSWINHTWASSINIDSFNISDDGTWINNSISLYYNDTSLNDGYSNLTIYGYNSTNDKLSDIITHDVKINMDGTPDTLFEYYDGSAWIEDTPPRMQYFRCYLWCTECANAEQSSTQHSLRITNNGTAAGIPKIRLNQNTPNTIIMYMDDDHTYAGAIILNDTYQVVGPELAPGESVYLSSWVDLVNPSSWPFETYAIVE